MPLAESFWAVGRMLAILAAGGPLIVVVDDIHWAEALLELIEHLVTTGAGTSCLLLCTARPGFVEERPAWGTASGQDRIALAPLEAADAGRLVEALLGSSGLPPAVQDRVTAASEGNPLYVEQFVSMLVGFGRHPHG